MVHQFLTQAHDQQFKDWLTQHPHGFYLNEGSMGTILRGEGRMILHRVGCHHLGMGEGVVSTTYAKVATDDREELLEWAKGTGLTVVACRSCKPEYEQRTV